MNKYSSLSLALVLLLSACSFPGGAETPEVGPLRVATVENPTQEVPPPSVANPNDECGNTYYPVVNGAEWIYTGPNGDFTHSLTTGSEGAFTDTVQTAESKFIIEGLCMEGGDINLLETPGSSLTYQGDVGSSTLTATQNEGISIPGDIQVGDDWSQSLVVEVSVDNRTMSFTIDNEFKATGYESVSVPAGTFETLKVEMESSTDGGNPLKQTLWYAQDVGLVKSVIDLGTPIVQELVSFSIPND